MDSKFEVRLAEQITSTGLAGRAEGHLLGSTAAKRVRPRFLFACGALLDVPTSQLLDLACVVELIHTATLIHDDLIDKATERRALSSVNAAFGNGVAVLAGDALLARAMLLITSGPQAQAVLHATTAAFLTLVEACVVEIELTNQKRPSTKSLLEIVDGKTGTLFALCGNLAGLVAQDSTAGKRLASAGNFLGRAFQIKDDIDDVEEDAANGTPTLPIVMGKKRALVEANRAIDNALSLLAFFQGHQAYPPLIATIQTLARM